MKTKKIDKKQERLTEDIAIHPIYWKIFLEIQKGKHTSTSIARSLLMSQGGIHTRLTKMEEAGLIKREEMNYYIVEDKFLQFAFTITGTDQNDKQYEETDNEQNIIDGLYATATISWSKILEDINDLGIHSTLQGFCTTLIFTCKQILINKDGKETKTFKEYEIIVPKFNHTLEMSKNKSGEWDQFPVMIPEDNKLRESYKKSKKK